MREIRYAFRTLVRNRGLSFAAILVFALGIGANTAIFTVVRAVLIAPLPYPDPDRIARLYERDVVGTEPFNPVSGPNFYDWKRDANGFESMGYYGDWGTSLFPSEGGLPEFLSGTICDAGFFTTLGAKPVLGRAFTEDDDRPGAERVAVISYSLWRRRFGATPNALGSSMRLDGELHNIVGVMPAGFDFPNATIDVWLPINRMLNPSFRTQRGNHRFNVVGRLKSGVSLDQARSEVDGIARRIKDQNPGTLTGKGANVVSLAERMTVDVRPTLYLLLGAVAFVLVIGCVNVANLLLSRAVSARSEVAIRIALGASATRIAVQFLTESLLLSLAGAGAGIVLSQYGTDVLIKMAGYTDFGVRPIPRIDSAHLDASVLAFTVCLAVLTGFAVGVLPAITAPLNGLTPMMRESTRSMTAGRSRRFFRDTMLAIEVALSLMLLIGAGVMLKSLAQLRAVDAGFNPDRMLTIRFSLPTNRYNTPALVASFYRDVLDRVRSTPGVESAGLVTVAPLRGHFMDNTFAIDGHPPLPAGQFLDAVVRSADPGYFKAAGIRLKRGRAFSSSEWLDNADKAVITESMASTFFPNEDPIGKRIRISQNQSFEVVGIVGDTRQNLAAMPEPMMYFPIFKGDYAFATLMIRGSGDPNLLSLPVQKQMRSLDPELPALTVHTIDEMVDGATQRNRFGFTLIALFAALAVILASVGLYGVLAYSVSQRTNELGVRVALGANDSTITKLIVWQALRPASAGIVVGIVGAYACSRLLQTMLYNVTAMDPAVLAAVILVLILVTLAASFIPARRATLVDPVVALRSE
jgi:predicted permease